MSPESLLEYTDRAQLWPADRPHPICPDVAAAYRNALAVRSLRIARGERPRGYKIGFTNRTIWQRYDVFAPIWGTVYDSTLSFCDGAGELSLAGICQPRLEPECVFGMAATPPPDASENDLFACIDWLAPGFEIVQSHCADWKFAAADTVADGGLHARLLVGAKKPIREVADNAQALNRSLASATVKLMRNADVVDEGIGANVLDGPLFALHHFLRELRACPGATDLRPGDVITTGTWTDAWPLSIGQTWRAEFTTPLGSLTLRLC